MALAGGAGGEAGRQAWAGLSTLVRRPFRGVKETSESSPATEIPLGVQGVGVFLTQHAPVPQQGVLPDGKGSLMIVETPEEDHEIGCRAQCAGIVGAEREAAPPHHLLALSPGLFVSTERGEAPV